MKKQIKWTLGTGAEATYTVELQLTKEINLDGDKSVVPCCEYNTSINVPGMGFMFAEVKKLAQPQTANGKTIVAAIGGKIGITDDIYTQIMAAIAEVKAHPAWVAKQEAIARNEQAAKDDYNHKKRTGYCFKCHSYCYGDCESN